MQAFNTATKMELLTGSVCQETLQFYSAKYFPLFWTTFVCAAFEEAEIRPRWLLHCHASTISE